MPDDEVELRLGRLEHEVVELREQLALTRSDASAARVLAAGADHDVSEVRAELRATPSASTPCGRLNWSRAGRSTN